MHRLLALSALAGCLDSAAPADEPPRPPISVEITRTATTTHFSGCYLLAFTCGDGPPPMQIRWADRALAAPYHATFVGGLYEATTDQIAGGDTIAIDFDDDTGAIAIPLDLDFTAPIPTVASPATRVTWTRSSSPTTLAAQWLCNDAKGGAYSSVNLGTFDTDPGELVVDVPASRPAHLADRTCTVSLRLSAQARAHGADRLGLVARQVRVIDLALE